MAPEASLEIADGVGEGERGSWSLLAQELAEGAPALADVVLEQTVCAMELLNLLETERTHMAYDSVIFQPRDLRFRCICGTNLPSHLSDWLTNACILDICLSEILVRGWFCVKCGLDVCHECAADIQKVRHREPLAETCINVCKGQLGMAAKFRAQEHQHHTHLRSRQLAPDYPFY